jgi:hypothetical protein
MRDPMYWTLIPPATYLQSKLPPKSAAAKGMFAKLNVIRLVKALRAVALVPTEETPVVTILALLLAPAGR